MMKNYLFVRGAVLVLCLSLLFLPLYPVDADSPKYSKMFAAKSYIKANLESLAIKHQGTKDGLSLYNDTSYVLNKMRALYPVNSDVYISLIKDGVILTVMSKYMDRKGELTWEFHVIFQPDTIHFFNNHIVPGKEDVSLESSYNWKTIQLKGK